MIKRSKKISRTAFLVVFGIFLIVGMFSPVSYDFNIQKEQDKTEATFIYSRVDINIALASLTLDDCPNGFTSNSHKSCKGSSKSLAEKMVDNSLNKLGDLMLNISSWFLAQAGGLMDKSIEYSVNLGDQKELNDSVEVGWKVFRDVANMFFIFILLYIAIATILQLNSFDTKRTLAKLIVVALLINFSLFATRIVISVSNVISDGFYTEITKEKKIAEQFTNQVGVIGIYTPTTTNGVTNVVLEPASKGQDSIFKVGLLGSVFLIILSFVFLAGAIMFIIRTVVLLFLMILSPLAFLGSILPATSGYAKQWWHALISNAFLAPIYLLLIWITLITIKGLAKVNGQGDKQTFASWLATGNVDGIAIFFNFAIITAMAVGALIISKSLGGWTGSTVVNYAQRGASYLGGKTKNIAGGAARGAGVAGYRNTFGWGATAAANTAAMKRFGASPRKRWAGLNRPLVGLVNKIAGVGGKRNYANVSKEYAQNREDAYNSTQGLDAKRKYFNRLTTSQQKKLYKTLSPDERAELRVKDKKLKDSLMEKLSSEEQKKTERAVKSVQSKDYAKALGDLTGKGVADAIKNGDERIINAIENIHLIEKEDIGKVSPEVMASTMAGESIEKMGAPLMNEFLKNTKATTEQLQGIAKTNISKLDEGHAIRRNIETSQRPEQIKMREVLATKNESPKTTSTSNANSAHEGNNMRDRVQDVKKARRGY